MLNEIGWHKPRLNHVYSVSSTRCPAERGAARLQLHHLHASSLAVSTLCFVFFFAAALPYSSGTTLCLLRLPSSHGAGPGSADD